MHLDDEDRESRRSSGDRGASLVEYALLLALIAVVCVAALGFFGGNLGTSLEKSKDSFISAGS